MGFIENTKEMIVRNIVVVSGIRSSGRVISNLKCGRKSHGFLYIWDGESTFNLDNGKIRKGTGGQLLYIPKGLRYKMEYTGKSTSFIVVNFDFLLEDMNPFSKKDIALLIDKDPSNMVANIMTKFDKCGSAQSSVENFKRMELFYRLMSVIYSQCQYTENHDYTQIAKGVMLLKQTYLENLPIEAFAKQSNISLSLFRQLFKKQYGTSPLQYRNLLRINRAKELLEYGNCTVAEVAFACGFENISFFCRYYKKVTGETPKQTKIH